jgi:uncharacterized protein (TIGR03435 family)
MQTVALALVLSLAVGVAQTTSTFDVVSVKPHAPDGDAGVRVDTQPGGRLTIGNASLRMLITFAYRMQDDQVVGGAEWTATDRFDVLAKGEREATTEELLAMLRPVLRDRFKLRLQNATRDLPVYALTVRADGKGAARRKPSDVDCSGQPGNGARGCAFSVRPGSIQGRGMPMRRLAAVLSQFAGRIVVDRTGVDAPQDFDLTWTPEFLRARPLPPGQTEFVLNGLSVDPNGPSLFTALQEQLGLKLESTKAPVDVLVIDAAERPMPD